MSDLDDIRDIVTDFVTLNGVCEPEPDLDPVPAQAQVAAFFEAERLLRQGRADEAAAITCTLPTYLRYAYRTLEGFVAKRRPFPAPGAVQLDESRRNTVRG